MKTVLLAVAALVLGLGGCASDPEFGDSVRAMWLRQLVCAVQT